MYTLLNNQEASKFDLYLPGKLVASLHYTINEKEVMFIYCEAIETPEAAHHCKELMTRSLKDVRNRHMKVTVTCAIALKFLDDPAMNLPPGSRTIVSEETSA
ncbi:hypothetical protein [Brevibacterium aurantiacum]|uniref:Uncharacterized protein n=1 Tax=Brevibacterium aurantiacum TaxID=273384 RepID=A0A2H1KGU1_BREAU|nr:hypothetical protein [Brevibacterium aurantiacum]AZL06686.1 hypothetical protein CXR24_14670 [Brevibacterium aurantiacum]GEB23642.1 hypothetical protein BAU01nite_23750 [Brevibacterium aurantiacum]SMX98402.1 hypothetical protein BAUR9175_03432 [Brevibacterium aurantiacum]